MPIRAAVGLPLSRLPSHLWGKAVTSWRGGDHSHWGGKIQKALRLASSARHFDDVYCSFLDEWAFDSSPVIGSDASAGFPLDVGVAAPDAIRMMYCDAMSYLPDDILCKVDRASMAVSLETRVPFLDHRVADVAARIPLRMKVRGNSGKHILRKLLAKSVPRELFERPKAGFGIPVGEWIKGPLRPWAEELLDPQRLREQQWFDVDAVRRRWHDHLTGQRNSTPAIWAILMFQAWVEEQKSWLADAA